MVDKMQYDLVEIFPQYEKEIKSMRKRHVDERIGFLFLALHESINFENTEIKNE